MLKKPYMRSDEQKINIWRFLKMRNETIIQNELIIDTKISDGAYRLYILLQSMCYGDKDTCYPSQEYLAEKLSKSVRTIQRYMDELVLNKLIKKKRRGSISNLITVVAKSVKKNVDKVIGACKKAYGSCKNKKKAGSFNNYDQREYSQDDISNMEKKLLGYL